MFLFVKYIILNLSVIFGGYLLRLFSYNVEMIYITTPETSFRFKMMSQCI